MHEAVKQFSEDGAFDEELWKRFAANLHYVAGDSNDPQLYQRATRETERDRAGAMSCFIFPRSPATTQVIVDGIGHSHLAAAPEGCVAQADRRKTFRPRSGERAAN